MRVYLSNYRHHWLSPYTIMEKVLFWKRWTDPEFDLYDSKNDKYTDWLQKPCELLQKFLDIVHPKIDYVKIDRWDTWSMDYTLAHIILPMLQHLRDAKAGAPSVDDDDVPDALKSTNAPPKKNDWDTDELWFDRWNYILDEMIFAFKCKVDDSWEDQFHSGEIDIVWNETGETFFNPITNKEEKTFTMDNGPKHTHKCDYEGMRVVHDRIQNGFRLFGKYYGALWR